MEIESKIILSKEEYEELKSRFTAADIATEMLKKDTYYSHYATLQERLQNNEPLIRIREEALLSDLDNHRKVFLTVKVKNTQDGLEFNKEYEDRITPDSAGWHLVRSSMEPYYSKSKYSIDTLQKILDITLHVELVRVFGEDSGRQIYALEIENTGCNSPLDMIAAAIELTFKSYGFTDPVSRYCNTSWRTLLGE